MEEKTINICGKEVTLRYCAATETWFEQIRNKSIADLDFNSTEDLITLGVCAIAAHYSYKNEDAPVDSKDILYEAKPKEIVELVNAVITLRGKYYEVPEVVNIDQPSFEESQGEEKPKN
jgi:hypothetical protein